MLFILIPGTSNLLNSVNTIYIIYSSISFLPPFESVGKLLCYLLVYHHQQMGHKALYKLKTNGKRASANTILGIRSNPRPWNVPVRGPGVTNTALTLVVCLPWSSFLLNGFLVATKHSKCTHISDSYLLIVWDFKIFLW